MTTSVVRTSGRVPRSAPSLPLAPKQAPDRGPHCNATANGRADGSTDGSAAPLAQHVPERSAFRTRRSEALKPVSLPTIRNFIPQERRAELRVGDKTMVIRTGHVARQAAGAVECWLGDTMVQAAVTSKKRHSDADFLPLTVDYQERFAGTGTIPRSRDRREGRASNEEILRARIIDRPLRPLFPAGYRDDTHVTAWVRTQDGVNTPDVLALNAASAALMVSNIPFNGPVAAVRVGRVHGKFVAMPTQEEQTHSDIDLIVAVNDKGIVMVEGPCHNVPEAEVVKALAFAKTAAAPLLEGQKELAREVGKQKRRVRGEQINPDMLGDIESIATHALSAAIRAPSKAGRADALRQVRWSVHNALHNRYPGRRNEVDAAFDEAHHRATRRLVLEQGKRMDGRALDAVRPISIEMGYDRAGTHGSALFTRGETQVAVDATVGGPRDKLPLQSPLGAREERFIEHYTFPDFSTGEVKPSRGPGRREIGHAHLAWWALHDQLPNEAQFPATVRITSDVLESNGSSSMATVCGTSLAMMHAGVPIKEHIAGIGMGLVKDQNTYKILTDITGEEDHLGDMDFKVAGTRTGITAIQMDIKCDGITPEVLTEALQAANRGRNHIIDLMDDAIAEPRPTPAASRVQPQKTVELTIRKEDAGRVIGRQGKTIKRIQQECNGVKINVDVRGDEGKVIIVGSQEATSRAQEMIQKILEPRQS